MKDVTGIIIRRKSFGKWLAFATLKILAIVDVVDADEKNDGPITNCDSTASNSDSLSMSTETIIINDESVETLRIVFQRKSPNWDKHYDSTFPIKNSCLPYGAKVKVTLKERHPDNKSACNQEVCSWEIIDDPRLIALEKARTKKTVTQIETHENEVDNDGDVTKDCDSTHEHMYSRNNEVDDRIGNQSESHGVLLHEYLKSRGLFYLQYNDFDYNEKIKEKKNKMQRQQPTSEEETSVSEAAGHGDKKAKSLRAKIFASWLVDEFGFDLLKQNDGVLDVAGGKGQLSIELSVLASGVQCTVIDPFIRGRSAEGTFLPNKESKRIKKGNGMIPQHIPQYFMKNEESNNLIARCSCVVGLHPDQPTEDIVDLALLHGKPFACIPCCVYPGLFTMRRLANGKFVQSYEDFIEYLLEKDCRLETTTLNFMGKNRVIYFKG